VAESKRFLLRLDPRLFETLRRWANDDLRSINAQIEYLLTDQARRAGRLAYRRHPSDFPDPPAPDEDADASADDGDSSTDDGDSSTATGASSVTSSRQ
jgi:hypothetical protein